jgi:hypothetical protein
MRLRPRLEKTNVELFKGDTGDPASNFDLDAILVPFGRPGRQFVLTKYLRKPPSQP